MVDYPANFKGKRLLSLQLHWVWPNLVHNVKIRHEGDIMDWNRQAGTGESRIIRK